MWDMISTLRPPAGDSQQSVSDTSTIRTNSPTKRAVLPEPMWWVLLALDSTIINNFLAKYCDPSRITLCVRCASANGKPAQ